MTTDHLGIACLAGCALIAAFVLLQLVTERRRGGIVGLAGIGVLAIFAATVGSTGDGLGWVTETARRSDAIGLGVACSIAGTAAGIIAGRAWRTTWAQLAGCIAGMVGIAGGLAAVAIGRATAHWEFVAIVTCGVALAVLGTLGIADRTATANRRILLGAIVALGIFAAVGGTFLGMAWSALA